MKYRGEYPPPKHEHGDILHGGYIQRRNRVFDSWEYTVILPSGITIFIRDD